MKSITSEQYDALISKLDFAVEKANNEIALRGCVEIELQDVRAELLKSFRENSELRSKISKLTK